MCGIAGYAGKEQAAPFLAETLKRLEYRGYDSWGVVTLDREPPAKMAYGLGAPTATLDLGQHDLPGRVGIGHTRWATHGTVCLKNAHPIPGTPPPPFPAAEVLRRPIVWVAHNGIIHNHLSHRQVLEGRGVRFETDTDTECVAHLLASFLHDGLTMRHALSRVAAELAGEYAFAAVSNLWPSQIGFVAHGSPLYVTMEGHLSSDVNALAGHAVTCYGMHTGDIGVLDSSGHHHLPRVATHIAVPAFYAPDLGGHPSYMHKEIHEQPDVFGHALADKPCLDGDVIIFGCGSSYNAALLGRHYLKGNHDCRVEYATEFADCFGVTNSDGPTYLAITQSGETKDTLRAIEAVRQYPHADIRVLTANENSTAGKAGRPIKLECGPEYGVAATKTFTATAVQLWKMANAWRGTGYQNRSLHDLSASLKKLLAREDEIAKAANWLSKWHNILYLGRGLLYPVAREGALKMKEVSYRHAEAIHAAEMKHGPIALIDECTLTVLLFGQEDGDHFDRIVANVEEVMSRGGIVMAVADDRSAERLSFVPRVLRVPRTADPELAPLVTNVALQLLAYYAAVGDGRNVDKPRNLAKSVTVE